MAHIKTGGTTKGNRDSISKRLGVKLFGGQPAKTGNIIVRQRGTKFHPGTGTKMGKDHTIYAANEGKVAFTQRMGKKFITLVEA